MSISERPSGAKQPLVHEVHKEQVEAISGRSEVFVVHTSRGSSRGIIEVDKAYCGYETSACFVGRE
jgi:hypothetical protein